VFEHDLISSTDNTNAAISLYIQFCSIRNLWVDRLNVPRMLNHYSCVVIVLLPAEY